MGNITDPLFWRRFSMAAHKDDEEKASKAASSPYGRPAIKQSQSWLDRQKSKKSHRTTICWIFWILIAFLTTTVIVTFLLLKRNGIIGNNPREPAPGEDVNAESYSIHGSGP
ncbi:hypothetical protein FKW77_001983 [Venturia effusa]|uniref:Uncharacterized protein n=1 Tax=Venturia effusa TaxID=50376 RepID=A0A517L2V4_9PEZI|nr:hypothetical protein FKW77_001983 [Venturia effusa]